MGIISVKKGWSRNSKLALIGMFASMTILVITFLV